MDISVLGAGTWGIALAKLLCENSHSVTVWSALPEEIRSLRATGRHPNLPDVVLPDNIEYTDSIETAVKSKPYVLFAVPSAFVRQTAAKAAPFIGAGATVIDVAKGIESVSLMTMTEVIADELSKNGVGTLPSLVALSGPTHAEEVSKGEITAIVSACEDEACAEKVGALFMNSCMRVYTNTDIKGVELCGALKNIIALATGMIRGMGCGDNTKALLMTRGMAEITRLGLAMGCKRRTFNGLAGIGDLIVTCTSRHSRNNRCGELIGRGVAYEDAAKEIGMVVEGYYALEAAIELSDKYNVDMPIVRAVNDVIKKHLVPADVIQQLMVRAMKSELD